MYCIVAVRTASENENDCCGLMGAASCSYLEYKVSDWSIHCNNTWFMEYGRYEQPYTNSCSDWWNFGLVKFRVSEAVTTSILCTQENTLWV